VPLRSCRYNRVRNPLGSSNASSLGLLLARAPLGVLFIVAGFRKFSAAGGVDGFLTQFVKMIPTWAPKTAGEGYLRAIPYAEIVVGAALVLGVASRVGGFAASILLTSFMVAVTGWRDANQPLHPNVIYLGVALLVMLAGPGGISMDRFMWGGGSAGFKTE
jgi:uncharacterized membrane protein YphA (DoxX/SURF4 family)